MFSPVIYISALPVVSIFLIGSIILIAFCTKAVVPSFVLYVDLFFSLYSSFVSDLLVIFHS